MRSAPTAASSGSDSPAPGGVATIRLSDGREIPAQLRAFTALAAEVRERGLLERARWFYLLVGLGVALAFGGAVTGFVLLGDSWYQLLIALALGIVFTQIAFVAHEAAHRQVLISGPNNERLARLLTGVVGVSLSWWDNKHSRHHANPNKVGKDPDIEVDTLSFVPEDAARSRGLIRLIPNLAAAAAIVRRHCAAHDVPYTETTLMRSYGIVVRYLNEVGLAARDPLECPMITQFMRGTGVDPR